MQFSLFTAFATLILTTVSADRSVVVLLNNGTASADSCSATELDLVSAVLTASSLNSTYARRNLRTTLEDLDDMTASVMDHLQHRALAFPTKCKNLCAGVATGRCLAVDCKGYRRRNLVGEQDERYLLSGASFTCTQQVDYINTELNKLASGTQVSSSCKTLLSKPRGVTCFDDVIYGVVEFFRLWITDTSPQTVLSHNFTGGDVCTHQRVAFQAKTNACVDFLLTTLSGSNGYYAETGEYKLPFSVFGDYLGSWNETLFMGRKLPVGQYLMTALPDGLLEKKKVTKFNVVGGSVTAVKLWDISAKTILNANFTGGNVCNNKNVNFEIVMSCALTSKTTVTSTNGFSYTSTESNVPFSALGDVDGILNGKKLANGQYTMTIYPDQTVSGNVKTVKFNVISC